MTWFRNEFSKRLAYDKILVDFLDVEEKDDVNIGTRLKMKEGERIMIIEKNVNGTELEMVVEGRMDTSTAPQFEAELKESIDGVSKLVLNFEKLEYISSAGLRVILSVQKIMNKQGKMVIRNVNEVVSEVFEITGFLDILTIE